MVDDGQAVQERRELRQHPTYPRASFIMNGFEDNLYRSQRSVQGNEITSLSRNGVTVRVISPEHPLLLLEQKIIVEGVGLYDRAYAFGADERLDVNKFSPEGLELLLETIKLRSIALKNTDKGEPLRQFHSYATLEQDILTGRLLASERVAPTVEHEITKLAEHTKQHQKRCFYCDIVRQEQNEAENEESRVVFLDENKEGYIGFVPFAPKGKDSLSVIPLKHVSRLTELSGEQVRLLAQRVYDSLIILKEATQGRQITTLNVVFYSAPINSTSLGNRNGFYDVSYHFHAGVLPEKPDSYEIPGADWFVVPGRPKDTAKKYREILEKLVRQPA